MIKKKLFNTLKNPTFLTFLITGMLVFFATIANAAMPVATSNPFEAAQTALQTLIESAISLAKWLGMGGALICLLAATLDRFNSKACYKIAGILIALSGLGWFIDLFMTGVS